MADVIPTKPHARSAGDVAAALACNPGQGLTTAEAERRRRVFGANRLRAFQRRSWVSILAHQFASLLVWLLAAAALLSFLMRDAPEALAILAVLVINAGIGFATELRAVRSMESLRRIARVRALVRRDGRVTSVSASDLVPGDIVVLGAGDVVAADLRLVKTSNLESNESILTGESVPVAKTIDAVAGDAVLGDRTSMVFKGTGITKGAGEGIVTATGMATELGRIADLTEAAEDTVSPLELRLDRLAQRLVVLTLGLAAMMVLVGTARGYPLAAMVETGIALAVAAVPEGLPVVATLCLARGMWRMAARNAVITRLSSVETLGATTLIMTDKTGTLTENQMAVVRYLVAEGDVTVTEGLPADPARVDLAVRLGAISATRAPGDDRSDMVRTDPMDLAMLDVAGMCGLDGSTLEAGFPKIDEHAFDPARKMMATIHRVEGGYLFAVKGAPEAVIAASDMEWDGTQPRPLDPARRADWMRRLSEAAAGGLRLIALATRTAASHDAAPFGGLTLVALVGLRDPLRADIPAAIRASRAAGVRVVMLTGDHADTAVAIAKDAGIGDADLAAAEGASLGALEAGTASDAQCERIRATDVFARVAPETKLALVRCFQDAGHVVAMTGDGVNDAPALRKADIGIAMGRRGTEVAREAADMVLKDDSFATIIAAMQQGRVIYDNIRRFVVYLMSCNVSEVLVVGIAVGAGLPAPLMPLQILFLNLVTDVFPAFALGFGQGDADVMRRPPRDPREPIAGRPEWAFIAILGSIVTGATLAAFWLAHNLLDLPNGEAVSVAFLTLALAQLWNVFNVRADGTRIWRNDVTRNPFVWVALALCIGLLVLAFRSPGLSDLLDLPNPGAEGLWLALGLSLVTLIAGQVLLLAGINGRLRSLSVLKAPHPAPTPMPNTE